MISVIILLSISFNVPSIMWQNWRKTDVRILIFAWLEVLYRKHSERRRVLRWVESDSYVDPNISKPAAIFCQIDGNLDLRLNALEMRVTAGSSAQAWRFTRIREKETQDVSGWLEQIRKD